MSGDGPIVNKVAQSGIHTLDMSEWVKDAPIKILDIKDQLDQGIILREKDFRSWVRTNDWESFSAFHVGIICSSNAIIPSWAYMLIAVALEPYAASVQLGDQQVVRDSIALKQIEVLDASQYQDERLVIKGCGEIGPEPYLAVSHKLKNHALSIMFGEPCSTVPVYKRKKT